MFNGLSKNFKDNCPKYDAIFVDEAQDFTREWAQVIRRLLRDQRNSRFGIFYDDVQVLREQSFADGFGIDSLPFLLRENIRNTANIYKWASSKTNLGTDVIVNPVEGPTPQTEAIQDRSQLTLRLEALFKKYLVDERLSNHSLIVLSDEICALLDMYPDGVAKWHLVRGEAKGEDEIGTYSVEEYKGLEADMIVYIHAKSATDNQNYIAYTRAKYYLIELEMDF